MCKEERKPIMLDKNTCAMIWLYTRNDELWDVAVGVYEPYLDMGIDIYKNAAKEFINQLQDRWCVAFLEALRDEINETIEKHNDLVNKKLED